MLRDLGEHPEKVEGVGQLLFEMCKGVQNMFHSCAETVKTRKDCWFKCCCNRALGSAQRNH